jgi:hypothetical protein
MSSRIELRKIQKKADHEVVGSKPQNVDGDLALVAAALSGPLLGNDRGRPSCSLLLSPALYSTAQ